MIYIKKGYGFNVGHDFARAKQNIPFDADHESGQWLYGYIDGDPQSSLGFLRPNRVRVRVQKDCCGGDQ